MIWTPNCTYLWILLKNCSRSILLSEVRSAEAVTAVRNSISSGHNILSTIHADKASSIPYRLYSLLESNIDVTQFMTTIYRYIQLGVHVRARYDKDNGGFMREVCEVCEFHVTKDNVPESHIIYRKNVDGTEIMNPPSEYLIDYLEAQGMMIKDKDYIHESSEQQAPVTIDNIATNVPNTPSAPTTIPSSPVVNSEPVANPTVATNPVSSTVSGNVQEPQSNTVPGVNAVNLTPVNEDKDLEETQFFDVFSSSVNQ